MNSRTHAKPGYSLDRADFLAVASVPYVYPNSCLLFLHYANQKTDPALEVATWPTQSQVWEASF